jgi:hypothetical protein
MTEDGLGLSSGCCPRSYGTVPILYFQELRNSTQLVISSADFTAINLTIINSSQPKRCQKAVLSSVFRTLNGETGG